MLQNLGPKERIAALVIACFALFGITFTLSSHLRRSGSVELHTAPSIQGDLSSKGSPLAPELPAAKLAVDVEGAVAHPGVYHLAVGSTAFDAVFAAGGTTPDAAAYDRNAAVSDGEKLLIPTAPTRAPVATTSTRPNSVPAPIDPATPAPLKAKSGKKDLPPEGSISINSATASELAQLPGIGPTEAQRIVDYRTSNGAFGSLDDLRNVKGIGEKKWQKLLPYVKL